MRKEFEIKIDEIRIKNFKSLRDVKFKVHKFNVLIGKNASGKTNFVDAVSFLKTALTEVTIPYAPHRKWWSYKDIVWNGDESLPISFQLRFEINPKLSLFDYEGREITLSDISYGVAFLEDGGVFQVYEEYLDFPPIFRIERAGEILRIIHSEDFLVQNWEKITEVLKEFSKYMADEWKDRSGETYSKKIPTLLLKALRDEIDLNDLLYQEARLPYRSRMPILLREIAFEDVIQFWRFGRILEEKFRRESRRTFPSLMKIYLAPPYTRELGIQQRGIYYYKTIENLFLISPTIRTNITRHYYDISTTYNSILWSIFNSISRIQILKKLNYSRIKQPKEQISTNRLEEDSSNIQELLYTWFLKPPIGSLPKRIESVIELLFPDTKLTFETTTDARIFIKIIEGNSREVRPPGISDGFYKILAIVSAIELRPSLLVIDEFETSLHAEAIEYLVDEIRSSDDTKAILTTHSPHLVDLTDPSDIVVVTKKRDGTSEFRRVKNPKAIKKKLNELGLTFSEAWLFGHLPEGE